jgi:hypothetical protein
MFVVWFGIALFFVLEVSLNTRIEVEVGRYIKYLKISQFSHQPLAARGKRKQGASQ